jgi:cephalosporin hydroxylase
MRMIIDTADNSLIAADGRRLDLYGKEAFELISDLWLKTSWNQKYSYTFTWLGRPIIQHPEDLIRLQEAIFTLRPDVIIETGVAHGGSLILYASLFKAMAARVAWWGWTSRAALATVGRSKPTSLQAISL